MKLVPLLIGRNDLVRLFALLFSLMSLGRVHAQPTIVSTVPPNGASGVPLSAALVITFSEAMSNSVTTAYLVDSTTYDILPASLSWSAGNTVLTCTPTEPFPENRTIWWTVENGQDLAGNSLGGYTGGTFTTVIRGPSDTDERDMERRSLRLRRNLTGRPNLHRRIQQHTQHEPVANSANHQQPSRPCSHR